VGTRAAHLGYFLVFTDAIFLILKKRSQTLGARRALGSRILTANLHCRNSGAEVLGEEGNAFDRMASPGLRLHYEYVDPTVAVSSSLCATGN
jgi:hypothetical protein